MVDDKENNGKQPIVIQTNMPEMLEGKIPISASLADEEDVETVYLNEDEIEAYLARYLSDNPNTEIETRFINPNPNVDFSQTDFTQHIEVKWLRPETPEHEIPPIIIREINEQEPPEKPLRIVQLPKQEEEKPPIIIRERPPVLNVNPEPHIIYVPANKIQRNGSSTKVLVEGGKTVKTQSIQEAASEKKVVTRESIEEQVRKQNLIRETQNAINQTFTKSQVERQQNTSQKTNEQKQREEQAYFESLYNFNQISEALRPAESSYYYDYSYQSQAGTGGSNFNNNATEQPRKSDVYYYDVRKSSDALNRQQRVYEEQQKKIQVEEIRRKDFEEHIQKEKVYLEQSRSGKFHVVDDGKKGSKYAYNYSYEVPEVPSQTKEVPIPISSYKVSKSSSLLRTPNSSNKDLRNILDNSGYLYNGGRTVSGLSRTPNASNKDLRNNLDYSSYYSYSAKSSTIQKTPNSSFKDLRTVEYNPTYSSSSAIKSTLLKTPSSSSNRDLRNLDYSNYGYNINSGQTRSTSQAAPVRVVYDYSNNPANSYGSGVSSTKSTQESYNVNNSSSYLYNSAASATTASSTNQSNNSNNNLYSFLNVKYY